MTLQQVVLILILVIPLVQALARRLAGSRTDEPPAETLPSRFPQPVFAPPVRVLPAPARDLPAQLRAAPPPPRLAPRQANAERGDDLSRPGASLLPRTRVGLQRAAALVAILGPPRALDPYGR
jgi:hypothetical protein